MATSAAIAAAAGIGSAAAVTPIEMVTEDNDNMITEDSDTMIKEG
jgi:hypothetical protein